MVKYRGKKGVEVDAKKKRKSIGIKKKKKKKVVQNIFGNYYF